MVVFDHINVKVKCRDQAAFEAELDTTEYQDDETPDREDADGSKIICRYIEVQANKFWQVKVKVSPKFDWQDADLVVARLYLDGKDVESQCLYKPKVPLGSAKARLQGSWSEDFKFLLFKFADLEIRDLTADDDTSKFRELYQDLGVITVKVHRKQRIGTTDPAGISHEMSLQPVPEKGLKGRPLHVATTYEVGPERRKPHTLRTTTLNKVAEINFKYRTKRALQSLLIIERSPSPIPLAERPVEELSREELMELERRRRLDDETERKRIKRERDDSDAPPMPPLKTSRRNGHVIYHIDSDDEEPTQIAPRSRTSGSHTTAATDRGNNGGERDVEEVTLL